VENLSAPQITPKSPEECGAFLIRDVSLPEGRSLVAGVGIILMVLGTVFLFVMPVMGIITITGALMVLFAVPASDPGSIRGWYVVRALAMVLIIGVLAMSTWSAPVRWWIVAITLSSAFFVGFTVLWVDKGFPKIYASFVDACSRLHRRHRKKH